MQTQLNGELVSLTLKNGRAYVVIDTEAKPEEEPKADPKSLNLAVIEREAIKTALKETKTVTEAAHLLGVNASTLWRMRKRYKLMSV